jgi:gliding motility-associated-like protein
MRLYKYIFVLVCLFFQVNLVSGACDFTSSEPVVIIPSGTHNSAVGYTQIYVLTDFNGDIIATSSTGNFGIQNFGSYNAYSINYDNSNAPVIPVVGVNISSINSGCYDISLALPITVCNTSVDSVCENSGNDIVIAMNPNYNFATGYNQILVVIDNATGNIVSIKNLDLITGSATFTTDAVTGELTLGSYTVYAVNYQNPETLATLGLLLGNAWTGTFGAACATTSGGDLIKVESCCGPITFDLDSTDLLCFNDFSGQINVSNINGGTPNYNFSIDNITYQTSTNFSNLDTGNYTVYIRDTLGCIDSTFTQINQPDELVLSFLVDSVRCFGGNTGQISVSVTGGSIPYNFNWSSSLNTDSIESNLFAGLDTLNVTDNNGCSIDTIIEVYEPTNLVYSSNIINANCGVADGSIKINMSGGIPNYQYSIDNGVTFLPSDSFPNLSAGLYDVVVEDAKGCQFIIQENIINNGAPVIDSLIIINPFCNGQTGQINVYASGGAGIIQYNLDGGLFQTNNDFTNLIANTYTVNIEDGNNCTLDSVVEIIEPSALNSQIQVTDVSCFGLNDGEISVTVSGGTSPYFYNWTSSANTDSTESNLFAGIDTLTVTDNNGCFFDSIITVIEPIDFAVDILVVDSIDCFGSDNGILSASVSPNPNDYQYNWVSPIVLNSPVITDLTTNIYTVVATNILTGCTDTNFIDLIEPEELVLTLDSNQQICIGQTAVLTSNVNGGTGVIGYNWNNGLPNNALQNVSPILTTEYTLNVTDENGCISDTLSVLISVRDSLHIVAFNDTTICEGSQVNISSLANGGDGNYNFNWSNGINTAQFNDSPNNSINYVITLTDGCGSPAVYDTVKVVVNQLPIASFNRDEVEGCYPVSSAYFANAFDATNQYSWVLSNGDVVSNLDSLVADFNTPGCYDLTLNVSSAEGCVSNSTFLNAICVYDYPVASFESVLNDDEFNSTLINFNNLSTGGTIFNWTFDVFGNSDLQDPSFEFPLTDSIGVYEVCLDVENIYGCSNSICDLIDIINEDLFFIPNTFTPDGDNRNDIFIPVISGYDRSNYQFQIFDRWGELIFETDDIDTGWDGVYKGTVVQQDVYVWKITAKKIKTQEIENYIGHVNVLK